MINNCDSDKHEIHFVYELTEGTLAVVSSTGWSVMYSSWLKYPLESSYTIMPDEEMKTQLAIGSLPHAALFSPRRVWVRKR